MRAGDAQGGAVKAWCTKLFGRANGSLDVSKLCMAALVLAYIGESAFALAAHHQLFDWQNFGIGAAALIAGSGAGVWMHGKSE